MNCQPDLRDQHSKLSSILSCRPGNRDHGRTPVFRAQVHSPIFAAIHHRCARSPVRNGDTRNEAATWVINPGINNRNPANKLWSSELSVSTDGPGSAGGFV